VRARIGTTNTVLKESPETVGAVSVLPQWMVQELQTIVRERGTICAA
jgi:hypothetical protein